jgi:hypothetical protein
MGLFHEYASEVDLKSLVYHVIYDGTRRIKGAGLLTGSGFGFLVVSGEKVFEDFAEEFGVEGDFLIDGSVLDNGELIAVQYRN